MRDFCGRWSTDAAPIAGNRLRLRGTACKHFVRSRKSGSFPHLHVHRVGFGRGRTSLSAIADREWLERAEVAIATVTAYQAERAQDVQQSRATPGDGAAWSRLITIAFISSCVIVEIAWVAGLVYVAYRFGVLDRLLSA